jgi:ribosomal peptide maturation radical SAM protein 1
MSDIVFVQMPFAGIERPSLALGLFMSSLKAESVSAESVYANIWFAEQIGLPAYLLMRSAAPTSLLGEWVFAESAFGSAASGAEVLPHLRVYNTGGTFVGFDMESKFIEFMLWYRGHSNLQEMLLEFRRQASTFVETLSQEIVSGGPKVVACTSMFDQHLASLALLQAVKRLEPKILTVIGGANCAGPMGDATHASFPTVDFTVTGEFDAEVVSFFNALIAAEGDAKRVSYLPPGVLGPMARLGLRGPRSSPPITRDMDRTAIPDYDDYFQQLYSSPMSRYVLPSIPLETSRGCWWGAKQHCTFCGLNAEGMAFRTKSPARALNEIRTLTSRYRVYRWAAADNIIDMSYFRTVLPELAGDRPKYNFFYETKANLKREQVQVLADSGCNYMQAGLESLHDETLQIMKKGTTACTNIQLLKYCLEFGVAIVWSVLCDFPGTDPEWVAQVADDLPSLFHLPPPLGTTPIRFDRFSPYHQRPGDYGLTLEPVPSYRLVYPFEPAVLNDLAYFFRRTDDGSGRAMETAVDSFKVTARWFADFWTGTRAELVIEADDGERIRIRDTRPSAVVGTHQLDGRLAKVLRALETPVSAPGLLRRLQAMEWSDPDLEDVSKVLEELRGLGLLWRSSTQYVALPTMPPKRAYPTNSGSAVGLVDLIRYLGDKYRFLQKVS